MLLLINLMIVNVYLMQIIKPDYLNKNILILFSNLLTIPFIL